MGEVRPIPTFGGVVRDDTTLHLEAVLSQQLVEGVPASILPLASVNSVGDGEHGGLHAGSFVFSTSVSPVISISLSIAFAMSYTVNAATLAAMRLVWTRMKQLVEPSSAVALAAVLARPDLFAGRRVGVILSGGNVDLDALVAA